jgi:hypothetical protein
MAKSKRSKKINFADLLAVAGGAIVAGKVGNLNLPIPEKIKPALPLLLSVVLSMNKNNTVKMIGYGMAGMGAVQALKAYVPQLGIGGENVSDFELIEGPGNYAVFGPEQGGANQGPGLYGPENNYAFSDEGTLNKMG